MPKQNDMVEYKGEQRALLDLCKEHKLGSTMVRRRLKRGWELERALTTPANPTGISPARRLKHTMTSIIRRAITDIDEKEFNQIVQQSLRDNFLGTLKELALWVPKDELDKVVANKGTTQQVMINVGQAYGNPEDITPL